jgi:hypothetical protein
VGIIKGAFLMPTSTTPPLAARWTKWSWFDPPRPDTERRSVRVWRTLAGANRLLPWRVALGGWEGRGHDLTVLADGQILVVYYTEGAGSQIRAQFLRADQAGIRSPTHP